MSESFLSNRSALVGGAENDFARAVAEKRRSGDETLDLSISNPTLARLTREWEPVRLALSEAANQTYAPSSLGSAVARERVSEHMSRVDAGEHGFFDVGVNAGFEASRLMLTASTSDSYSYLFKALCDAGECVMVPEPSYPLLGHLAALDGVRAVPYRLCYDGAWHVDWDSVSVGLQSRPKAIVVVTPNNPTASCLTNDEFQTFADQGVPLIVDQVFSPYARRDSGARPLPFDKAGALTFVLDGLSKRCALPQLKVGWIGVFGPRFAVEPVMAVLDSIGDTYLGVNSISEGALGSLLDASFDTRRAIRARLAANLDHLQKARAAGAAYSMLHYQGGWTALLRLPNYKTDDEWARSLLARGVIVQPGWLYDCPDAATLVVSLLTPEDTFRAGLAELRALLAD